MGYVGFMFSNGHGFNSDNARHRIYFSIRLFYCFGFRYCEAIYMSYNWCHGPNCHERATMDRIRGSKGSKVLRTKRIRLTQWNQNNVWSHFCSQGCWNDFMNKHWIQAIALEPRREPLTTPIKDPVKNANNYWNRWNIEKKEVDNV